MEKARRLLTGNLIGLSIYISYQDRWYLGKAGQFINKARVVVVVGYSLPKTDLPTQALFRLGGIRIKGRVSNTIEDLVVANPDADARRRTIDVFKQRLTRSSRVIVFDCLDEFARVLESGEAEIIEGKSSQGSHPASQISRPRKSKQTEG